LTSWEICNGKKGQLVQHFFFFTISMVGSFAWFSQGYTFHKSKSKYSLTIIILSLTFCKVGCNMEVDLWWWPLRINFLLGKKTPKSTAVNFPTALTAFTFACENNFIFPSLFHKGLFPVHLWSKSNDACGSGTAWKPRGR